MDLIRDQNKKRNLSLIKIQWDIFGLLFIDNGATIYRTLLLNILVSGGNILVYALEIFDCQGSLADGAEKYRIFIYKRFLEHKTINLIR